MSLNDLFTSGSRSNTTCSLPPIYNNYKLHILLRFTININCRTKNCTTTIRHRHRRTGLEILGGGHEFRGVRGHAPQENFEK